MMESPVFTECCVSHKSGFHSDLWDNNDNGIPLACGSDCLSVHLKHVFSPMSHQMLLRKGGGPHLPSPVMAMSAVRMKCLCVPAQSAQAQDSFFVEMDESRRKTIFIAHLSCPARIS